MLLVPLEGAAVKVRVTPSGTVYADAASWTTPSTDTNTDCLSATVRFRVNVVVDPLPLNCCTAGVEI
jgi:hypothetical protein